MITTRFYLEGRYAADGQLCPLKIVITKNSERAYISTSVSLLPENWDARRQLVVGHPRKVLMNNLIQGKKVDVDDAIFRLQKSGALAGLRAREIKDLVLAELFPVEDTVVVTLYSCFLAFIEKKAGRTREIYEGSLSKLESFCPAFASIKFEEVDFHWLEEFDAFLAKTATSRNTRNIHLRNLRAVFNFAINEEVTSFYPFRKFKIKPQKTRKRALSVQQFRKLLKLEVDSRDRRYLDFFLLSFMLCGINVVDLCRASFLVNGRLEYDRAKTQRPYSIKVEPEALEIIKRYAGARGLVNFAEGCKDYRSFYKHLADSIRAIGVKNGMPGLSTYWARHSWATFAAELDVPDPVISMALGHGPENPTTDLYIQRNLKKIDSANRRILDWVLYDKR